MGFLALLKGRIAGRRKGTGKEQTFLAFKTLVQNSEARSHQSPQLKPKPAMSLSGRSHSHGRNTWSWICCGFNGAFKSAKYQQQSYRLPIPTIDK